MRIFVTFIRIQSFMLLEIFYSLLVFQYNWRLPEMQHFIMFKNPKLSYITQDE